MFDRIAVDVHEFLEAAVRVKAMLISLASLDAVILVALRFQVDVSDRPGHRLRVVRREQIPVNSGGDELDESAARRRDRWHAHGHCLDADKPERLFASGRDEYCPRR